MMTCRSSLPQVCKTVEIPGQRLSHSPDLLINHILPLCSSLQWQSSALASMHSGQRSMHTSALS